MIPPRILSARFIRPVPGVPWSRLLPILVVLLLAWAGLARAQDESTERYKPEQAPDRLHELNLQLPGSGAPLAVTVEEKDGLLILEGDILLGRADELLAGAGKTGATVILNNLWPNARIPFQIDANVPNQARITNAITQIQNNSQLRFIQRTAANAGQFPDFVRIVRPAGPNTCASFVGRIGGQQQLTLGDNCSTGNTVHELMHAAGFFHEQSRYDRSDYVTVNFGNIQQGQAGNFQICTDCNAVGPYDYGSMMHYSAFAFSSNGQPTITTRVPGAVIGQRAGLSAGDMHGLACLYGGPRCYPSFQIANFGYNAGGWRVEQHPRMMADVNGDGRDDIVGFGNAGTYVSVSTSSGFTWPQLWVASYGYDAGGWRVEQHPRMMADVNGDNRADVVGFGNAGVYVSFSTGSSFTAPQLLVSNFGYNAGGWRVEQHPRFMADVNGDGLDDVVGFGNDGVSVALSTGSGFGAVRLWVANFGYNAGSWRVDRHPRMMADVDGDGRADVVGFGSGGVSVSRSTGIAFTGAQLWVANFGYSAGSWRVDRHPRMMADVDGDGRADVVGFGSGGASVSLSTGTGFTGAQLWVDNFGYSAGGWRVDEHPRFLADVNGDGRDDVIGFGYAGAYVSLSTGTRFAKAWAWSYTFGHTAGNWRVDKHPRFLASVNSDNRADIVGFGDAGVFLFTSDDMVAAAVLPPPPSAGGSGEPEEPEPPPGGHRPDVVEAPEGFALEQNYPNPFNPATEITFALTTPAHVRLSVYDLLGREVARLVDEQMATGSHRVQFDASHLSSGTYLYRVEAQGEAGRFTQSRRMVLVK